MRLDRAVAAFEAGTLRGGHRFHEPHAVDPRFALQAPGDRREDRVVRGPVGPEAGGEIARALDRRVDGVEGLRANVRGEARAARLARC